MVYIFEDNPDMTVSKLLTTALHPSTVIFSCGSGNLFSKIKEYEQKEDVCAFVDVAPNNKVTMSTYRRLLNKVSKLEKQHKVALIPITCIEEVVLRALNEIGRHNPLYDYDAAFKTFTHIQLHKESSAEVAYKHILYNISTKQLCFKNANTNNFHEISYYTCNCDDVSKECDCVYREYQRQWLIKALNIYMYLPMHIAVRENSSLQLHNSITQNMHIEIIKKERESFYAGLCKGLSIATPKELLNIIIYPIKEEVT